MKYYTVIVWGDVDPSLLGPFDTNDQRDQASLDYRTKEGPEDGIYWIDIHDDGAPIIGPYSGVFFEEVDDAYGSK